MKILMVKTPTSGWWNTGIPKYNDNPAMQEGSIPNTEVLDSEREKLKKVIYKTEHELIEIDFPKELDQKEPGHDFIFIRDPFISNQKGKVIILRSGEPLRRRENHIIKNILEEMGYSTTSIPDKKGIRADGGEFYFCGEGDYLFAGIQRNTRKGIESVAEALDVKKLLILDGLGYHLDTFFTPVLHKNGELAALIVCSEILSMQSKKDLMYFAERENLPVFRIPPMDAIGTSKKLGTFAVNALPLPGLLIRPNNFTDPALDQKISDLGIECAVTPTSQFQLSGGSIHCVTNEL
jgi:N-dimethylarginine dimethylaminohydrolase